jgi:hypothetical protein
MHARTLSSWREIAFFACGRFRESVVTPGWDRTDWRKASWVLTAEKNLRVVNGCRLVALRREVLMNDMRRCGVKCQVRNNTAIAPCPLSELLSQVEMSEHHASEGIYSDITNDWRNTRIVMLKVTVRYLNRYHHISAPSYIPWTRTLSRKHHNGSQSQ